MTLRAESHHLKSELEIVSREKVQTDNRLKDLEVSNNKSVEEAKRFGRATLWGQEYWSQILWQEQWRGF